MRRVQTADSPHAAINISRIPVGGGVAGLIIAASIIVIGLIGLPAARWFLGGSIALGVIVALARMWLARD